MTLAPSAPAATASPLARWLLLAGVVAMGGFLAGFGALRTWAGRTYFASPSVPVLKSDIPAFHQIRAEDLEEKPVPSGEVPVAVLRASAAIVDRYTLMPLKKGKVLSEDQLGPPLEVNELADKVVVGIPATPAMVFGGALKAGTVADLILVGPPGPWSATPPPLTFEKLRILDVRVVEFRPSERAPLETPYVVTVAMPTSRFMAFITRSRGATFQVILHP